MVVCQILRLKPDLHNAALPGIVDGTLQHAKQDLRDPAAIAPEQRVGFLAQAQANLQALLVGSRDQQPNHVFGRVPDIEDLHFRLETVAFDHVQVKQVQKFEFGEAE